VQIRSYATGTVVRLVVARQPRRTNSGWSWPVN
jgi:hypothetical protein